MHLSGCNFEELQTLLSARLALELPGHAAQRSFEPELAYGRHAGPPLETARQATVLIMLYQQAGGWHFPLAVRPGSMTLHAGQIALPGGSIDEEETTAQAALRELEEELGVPREDVRLLGMLTPLYTYVSNFIVTPWIGMCAGQPQWQPSPAEVAEVIELPVGVLLDPAHRGTHSRRHRGIALRVPHIALGRHHIWGTTAMILGEFIALLEGAQEQA